MAGRSFVKEKESNILPIKYDLSWMAIISEAVLFVIGTPDNVAILGIIR
ncbi:MAG: hypothetical protein HZA13_05895 [Nitrospirae bacterium]|nr:hypothetical protein [Nitrospirota bacterium]